MTIATADRVLELLGATPSIDTVDITGGAPELNQAFHYLVRGARNLASVQKRELRIIDRCNLTVLCEPGMETLPQFLSKQKVDVIASLPCYSEDNCDQQRGRNVFKRSIKGLNLLNQEGFGKDDGGRRLDLTYNPLGAFLPPPQQKLEAAYKEELKANYDVSFNSLICIANMPIKRFHDFLKKRDGLETYMSLLVRNFNANTVEHLMCRNTVSISWDGFLFDCDFNMQLDLHLLPPSGTPGTGPGTKGRLSLWDIRAFDDPTLQRSRIRTMAHCFACTAAQGSS
jgi:radical SAM/Cys-rich protein